MKRFLLTIALICLAFMPLFAQEDSFFSDDSDFSEESASSFTMGGTLSSSCSVNATEDGFKAVFDRDSATDELAESTSLELTGSFAGPKTDFQMDLDFALDGVGINEAYGKYYGEYTTITAGYNKTVWGMADEFHVVDVLNSLDLSDFLQTDYLSMVISKPMFKVDAPLWGGLLLEAAWIPTFEGNNIPMDSKWSPAEMKTAYAAIENAVIYKSVATYSSTYESTYTEYLDKVYAMTYAGAIASGASAVAADAVATAAITTDETLTNADVTANAAASLAQTEWLSANQNGESFYNPMNTLDNSQFGVHLSGTAGGFDFGIVYYYGYNKIPSLTTTVDPISGITDASISYDPMQTFGAECSGILAGFKSQG